jgi:hypothetical protein
MGIDPMNNISIIIRILFAVTIFQQRDEKIIKKNKEQVNLSMFVAATSLAAALSFIYFPRIIIFNRLEIRMEYNEHLIVATIQYIHHT